MAFDIQGALDAGYTKKEASEYLAKENRFDIAAARKSGYSDDEIISHLSGPPKQEIPQQAAPTEEVPQWGRDNPTAYGLYGAGKAIVDTSIDAAKEGAGLVGMLGGGLLGGATAGPGGAVVGAGLGHAAWGQAGRTIDSVIGGKPTDSFGNAALYALDDFAEGAAMETMGQVTGPILKIAKGIKPTAKITQFIPGTQANAERNAQKIYAEYKAPASESTVSAIEGKSINNANALLERQGIKDNNFTHAQSSGNLKSGWLEQGRISQNEDLMQAAMVNDSEIAGAVRKNLLESLPKGQPVVSQAPEEIGAGIVRSLKAAEAPLKEAEKTAWGAINKDYEITTSGIDRTFAELQDAPLADGIKGKIEAIKKFYDRTNKTVGGIREVKKDITQKINNAVIAGDTNDARILGILNKSFDQEFKTMATAAKSGDVAQFNGKIVYPKGIQEEITKSTKALSEMETAGSVPDADAILTAIRSKGFPSMRSPGEDVTNFNKRMAIDYQKYFGKEPPMIADAKNAGSIAAHSERLAKNQEILAGMQPADDVAAQIQKANAATIEKQRRLGRGVTAETLRYGNKDSGLKKDFEKVARDYFTPAGSTNLIKAVGKPEAGRMMIEHVKSSFEGITKGGVLDLKAAENFLNKNIRTLGKFGIIKDTEKLIGDNIEGALRKRLGDDGFNLDIDRLLRDKNTQNQIKKIIIDYAPLMNRVFGKGNRPVQNLLDYHQTLRHLGLNKNVSYSGNSTTFDKLVAGAKTAPDGPIKTLFYNLATLGTVVGTAVNPGIGSVVGGVTGRAAQTQFKSLTDLQKKAISELIDKAILNPEGATFLNKVSRGHKPTAIEMEKVMEKNGITWKSTAARLAGAQMAED